MDAAFAEITKCISFTYCGNQLRSSSEIPIEIEIFKLCYSVFNSRFSGTCSFVLKICVVVTNGFTSERLVNPVIPLVRVSYY